MKSLNFDSFIIEYEIANKIKFIKKIINKI